MTIALQWNSKTPAEVVDYSLDWAARLEADTIEASTWSILDNDDDALVIDSNSFSDTATLVWISGGTAGKTYTLLNHVTTAGNRQYETCVSLPVVANG